jgi:endoglycosylceramidase
LNTHKPEPNYIIGKTLLCLLFGLFAGTANAQITDAIKDAQGRELILHGLNTSGSAKFDTAHMPWIKESDVDREHTQFGFNTVRFLIFWGAMEPEEGVYNEHYLAEVKKRVEWYTSRHMYVVFDMHQDVFGYGVGDNGAPAWAAANDAIIKHLVPNKWPWWMKNLEPKIIKSYVQFFTYKKHKNRQQHYIACWQKVAGMFKDNPYVLGYDLMNEPHGGKIIKTLAGGFERRQLSAMYKRLIPAIRSVDTAHYIFFEPRSFGVNFGMPSHLPKVYDTPANNPKLVYSAHCYLKFVDIGGDYKPKHVKELPHWFAVRDKELKKQQCPLMIGEFGLSPQKKDFDAYLRDLHRMADERHASWSYWSNDHGGWSPLKADNSPTPILPELLRVFPQATAGRLMHYSYDPATKIFEMDFTSNAAINAPTEIAVPRSFFPEGYKLDITGTTQYHYDVDEVTNSIKLFVTENGAHVMVKLSPK